MRIESISIKNFKSLQNITMNNIPPFCVIVGANGTGKSTLFDVFGFLRDCLTHNVRQALAKRGGFREVVSREHTGETISIIIQFRLDISGVERLVTYSLEIKEEEGKPVIKREILRYKRGAHGSPFHFLDFKRGEGYAITNEEDFNKSDQDLTKEKQKLDTPDILAIKGLGQFERFKAASNFRQLIENWHVSDFHITAARGSKEAGYAEHLSETGDNLPLVAQYLYEHHPKRFEAVLRMMQDCVPGVSSIEAKPTDDGRILLRIKDGTFHEPFIDRFVSDGTIKLFAYLVLLNDPEPHPLLCVEKPEHKLYPTLLGKLAEKFRIYAMKKNRGAQVFVSTHSPNFLNAARLEEVFWLSKKEGSTQVQHAADDPQLRAYMEDGDKMGYLWKQGFFPGIDP